jgi:DNA gyrase inhibitor GyrI
MYNMSGEEGEGRNMEKVFATWEKLFATWKKCSQHDVWILVATSSPQARNMFATNSQHVHYVREGGRGRNMEKMFATWEKVFATWKKCSQHEKRCSQHEKSFRNMGKGVRNIRNRFATS